MNTSLNADGHEATEVTEAHEAQAAQAVKAARDAGRGIAVVGGGSIGVAFAIVFARAGWPVRIVDPDLTRRQAVAAEIHTRLTDLQGFDLLDETPETIGARVTVTPSLEEALQQVLLVQECAPERLEVKRSIFAQLDAIAPADALIASASSTLPASSYASDLPGRERCLVTHPGNPPYLLPVIEIVPAPFTAIHHVALAHQLYRQAGLTPVHVKREVEGFVYNRLQGAVLREAYCLVRDGVASVEDIDRVVRDGLGLRWSVIGPFETVDLNTRGGIASHAEKLGPAYARMGAERGQNDPWTAPLVTQVTAQRRALLPLTEWESRVNWRDRQLMRLAKLRKTHKSKR